MIKVGRKITHLIFYKRQDTEKKTKKNSKYTWK